MKLFFKPILIAIFMVISVLAKGESYKPLLVSYHQGYEKALQIKRILRKELLMPESLIAFERRDQPCVVDKSFVLQLCVTKDNKMDIVYAQMEELRSSFSVFFK